MTEPTKPLSGGQNSGRAPIRPDTLTSACQCIRCKLTAIHGDLLRLAIDLPEPFEQRAVDAADAVFDLLRREPSSCEVLQEIRERIGAEALLLTGTTQSSRLWKIADDLRTNFERIVK